MQKIERLMAIILALKKNKKMTAKELSKTFEVDIRTIYRDMQALSEMNVPIISSTGNDGGYEILDEYFIPPIMFNKDEVFALLLAKKIVDIVNVPGYNSFANSAFLKLENLVNQCYKNDFQDIQDKIIFDIKPKDIDIKNSYVFETVKKALKFNNKMEITYISDKDLNLVKDKIQPYGIVFEEGTWYIVAFSEDNKSKVHINVEKIKESVLIEEAFQVPKDFSIDNYYSKQCFKGAYNNKDSVTIKLRINKEIYPTIKDYVFFKYGEVKEEERDYIVYIKTLKVDFYISLAFRFFREIEILEPLWVRDKFIEELSQLNRIYKN